MVLPMGVVVCDVNSQTNRKTNLASVRAERSLRQRSVTAFSRDEI
jgi:hypothetical protein